MNTATYTQLCDLVYEQSGIRIQPGKEAMVSARLAKRIRQVGLQSETEYLEFLQRELTTEVVQLLDLMTTNVTHFFRESEHFDFIAARFKEWIDGGQRRFRFWSAASSTGEEPYSLAMTLHQAAGPKRGELDLRILATDISTRVLAKAERAHYPADDLEEIPVSIRNTCFRKAGGGAPGQMVVEESLRKMVLFRRLNLSTPPFPMTGPLDTVFCRNVMFYFDDPVREALVNDIHRLLRPSGFLITGKSESVPALRGKFERVGPSVFRRLD